MVSDRIACVLKSRELSPSGSRRGREVGEIQRFHVGEEHHQPLLEGLQGRKQAAARDEPLVPQPAGECGSRTLRLSPTICYSSHRKYHSRTGRRKE